MKQTLWMLGIMTALMVAFAVHPAIGVMLAPVLGFPVAVVAIVTLQSCFAG